MEDAKALAAAVATSANPEDADKLADNAGALATQATEELAAIRAAMVDEDPDMAAPPGVEGAAPGSNDGARSFAESRSRTPRRHGTHSSHATHTHTYTRRPVCVSSLTHDSLSIRPPHAPHDVSVNPLSHTTPVCHPRLVNAGKEFRFLKPKQSAPEAEVVKSALKALGPRKALACRVIGGFPIGREFKKPITLKVN